MDGPAHYLAAEKLLAEHASALDSLDRRARLSRQPISAESLEVAEQTLAAANVHATLAQTAAIITAGLQADPARPPVLKGDRWHEVLA